MKKIFFAFLFLFFSSSAFSKVYEAVQGGVIIYDDKKISRHSEIVDDGNFPKSIVCNGGKCFILIAVDMAVEKGVYGEKVAFLNGKRKIERRIKIVVKDAHFPEQHLTLPDKYVELDPETLERVTKENLIIKNMFENFDAGIFEESFIKPLTGEISTQFGSRRIINGQPRKAHSGIDFESYEGAEVYAAASGKVVLTGDFFFNGKSVFIDHGSGLFTMYFHLSEIMVKEGDKVKKSELVGLVGSTGRSTAPHLHFGMRLKQAKINPLSLIEKMK